MAVLEETFVPDENEVQQAKDFARDLGRQVGKGESVVIQNADMGESVAVPKNVFDVLMKILAVMSEGNGFALIPMDKEITTQEAADILNVSRPFVVKLAENKEIVHRKVGRNRRFKLRDVLAYKQKQDAESNSALDELAAQAQELDMGY